MDLNGTLTLYHLFSLFSHTTQVWPWYTGSTDYTRVHSTGQKSSPASPGKSPFFPFFPCFPFHIFPCTEISTIVWCVILLFVKQISILSRYVMKLFMYNLDTTCFRYLQRLFTKPCLQNGGKANEERRNAGARRARSVGVVARRMAQRSRPRSPQRMYWTVPDVRIRHHNSSRPVQQGRQGQGLALMTEIHM